MADKSLAHPPIFDKELSDYNRWKSLTEIWSKCTSVGANKMAMLVVMHSLPAGSKIQNSVVDELGYEQLDHKEGMKRLFAFMDKYYKKNHTSAAVEIVSAFNNCRAENFECMDDFILEHNRLYNQLQKIKSMSMGEGVRGLLLLDKANLSETQRQLVLTGVNLDDDDNINAMVESSLLKFFGKQAISSTRKS